MAKYESKYLTLGFYVDNALKRFSAGVYETNDKDEIAVLDGLVDAVKVEEPKTEAKPATKAPAKTTKASAK